MLDADDGDQHKAGQERPNDCPDGIHRVDAADGSTELFHSRGAYPADQGEDTAQQQGRDQHDGEAQRELESNHVSPGGFRGLDELSGPLGQDAKEMDQTQGVQAYPNLNRPKANDQSPLPLEPSPVDIAAQCQAA